MGNTINRLKNNRTVMWSWFKIGFVILIQVIIAFTILPTASFSDSDDYLVGGCLISRGEHIYTDFFSHHGPLAYYLMALIYKLIGTCHLLLPRYLVYASTVFSLWFCYRQTKSYTTLVITTFFILLMSFHYQTVTPTSESIMVIAIILAYTLMQSYKKIAQTTFWILFAVVQLLFVGLNPLYSPISVVILLYFLYQQPKSYFGLIVSTFLPGAILFTHINVGDFYKMYVSFNTDNYISPLQFFTQYQGYLVVQLENIYRTLTRLHSNYADKYLLLTEFVMFIGFFYTMYKLYKNKKFKKPIFFAYFFFMIFLSVRIGGFHMYPGFFLMLLIISQFAESKILKVIILGFILIFSTRLFFDAVLAFKINKSDRRLDSISHTVRDYSYEQDTILFYPLRPEVYLISRRVPGSYYYIFLPWVAKQRGAQQQIIRDIKNNNPALIFFEKDWIVNDQPIDLYMKTVLSYLNRSPKYKKITIEQNQVTVFVNTRK